MAPRLKLFLPLLIFAVMAIFLTGAGALVARITRQGEGTAEAY